MGHVQRCDARCHRAKSKRCACWCGGKFHGSAGAGARAEFAAKFGVLPEAQEQYEATLRQGQLFERQVGA